MTAKPTPDADLQRLLADAEAVEAAIQAAECDTLREHKLLGLPIVVWREGRVQWIPPEEIVVESEALLPGRGPSCNAVRHDPH